MDMVIGVLPYTHNRHVRNVNVAKIMVLFFLSFLESNLAFFPLVMLIRQGFFSGASGAEIRPHFQWKIGDFSPITAENYSQHFL